MTRDDIIRMAREAGIAPSSPHLGIRPADLAAIERFAELVADAGRLEGWQAAREIAAIVGGRKTESQRIPDGQAVADAIRAMQPPAEWQCAEARPVCGAATNDQRLSADEIKAMVGEEDFRKEAKWPHPDGFAGGLTERDDLCGGR